MRMRESHTPNSYQATLHRRERFPTHVNQPNPDPAAERASC